MLNNISSCINNAKASNISFESRRYIPDALLENKEDGSYFTYTPKSGETFSIELKASGHKINREQGDHFKFSQTISDMGSGYNIEYDITTKPFKPADIGNPGGIEVISAKTKEGNEVGEKRLDLIWESILAAITRPSNSRTVIKRPDPEAAETKEPHTCIKVEPEESKTKKILKHLFKSWY